MRSVALVRPGAARLLSLTKRGRLQHAAAGVVWFALLAAPRTSTAEEISLLGGLTDTDDHTSASYAWGLEYRQFLTAHLDATFGYLNEGHLPNHQRDGMLLQLWADTGQWQDRIAFSFGAGPYVYFDTEGGFNFQGYRNQHGVGVLLSGRASYALSPRWFALLQLEQVLAISTGTRTLMLGAGYRLDSVIEALGRMQHEGPSAAVSDLPNEIDLFGGQTVLNDLRSDKSTDFGVEYRRRVFGHVEFSASLLDEGGGAVGQHAAVTGEAWLVQDFLERRLVTGLGVGPYFALSTYLTSDGRVGASTLGLASMTASWRFTNRLALRINWHRAFTGDDQDRDIITLGLGWRF
jgi:hypothetical protein